MPACMVSCSTGFAIRRRSLGRATLILITLFVSIASHLVMSQTARPTDLEFHKFRPKIAPEQAYAGALTRGTSPSGIGPMAAQQMLALQQQIQEESQRFTTISNVMRAKYDTAKAAVSNIRA